jgi:hypothetical protein
VKALRRRILTLLRRGFPFHIASKTIAPLERLRAIAPARLFAHRPRTVRFLIRLAMSLGWPVIALWDCVAVVRLTPGLSWQHLHRLLDIYAVALRNNVQPIEYAIYRLNEERQRSKLPEFLYNNDLPALALLGSRQEGSRDVNDKVRFAQICSSHALSVVSTLAAFQGGEQIVPQTPFRPTLPKIWVKPVRGARGEGSEAWIKLGDVYCNSRGERISADSFASHCIAEDCLVQPFLTNHPDLEPLTNGALAALRVVTGRRRTGEIELIGSYLMLPFGRMQNSTHGIVCAVDEMTGRINRALEPGRLSDISRRPDTDMDLIGAAIPLVREAKTLVARAHREGFAHFVFLGWDVAITEKGPILLEANINWFAMYHQVLDGPLGVSLFSDVLGEWLP